MPADWIQGLLGGMASGYAGAEFERQQQSEAQEREVRKQKLQFIQMAINSPNFDPAFLPVALEHLDEIVSAKPGKKGRGKVQSSMKSFGAMMQPRPTPEQVQAVDPTGRRSRYGQETSAREAEGMPALPRSFDPVPGIDPMMRSQTEMNREDAARAYSQGRASSMARAPEREEEIRIRAEENRKLEAQRAEQRKALTNFTLEKKAELYPKMQQAKVLAASQAEFQKYRATLPPEMADEQKDALAQAYVQEKMDSDLSKRKAQLANIQSLIGARAQRLQNDLTKINQAQQRIAQGDARLRRLYSVDQLNQLKLKLTSIEREMKAPSDVLRNWDADDAQKAAAQAKVDELTRQHDALRQTIDAIPIEQPTPASAGFASVPGAKPANSDPLVGKIVTTKDGRRIRVKTVANGKITDYEVVK